MAVVAYKAKLFSTIPWWLAGGIALMIVDLAALLREPEFGWPQALHLATLVAGAAVASLLWQHWQRRLLAAAQLMEAVNSLDEGLAIYDADDRLVMVNEAFRRQMPQQTQAWQFGDRFEDLLRRSVDAGEIVAARGREEAWIQERLRRHSEAGEPWIHELANGHWVRVHERRTASGFRTGLRADVTELVRTQHALEQAQGEAQHHRQLLERALDAMPVGIEIYDDKDRLILANRRVRDWYPQVAAELGQAPTFEGLLRHGLSHGTLPIEAMGREDEWLLERISERGKSDRPLLQHWSNGLWLMIHERRTPEGFLVCARLDVTDLVAKERALQTSQAQLQAIIGTAGVAILTLDAEGRISSANPATERMLGYLHGELLNEDMGILMDAAERSLLGEAMHAYIDAEDRGLLGRQRECKVLHKAGRELTVQLALAEVRSGGERVFVAVLTDITERKRFELELQHANEQLLRLSTTDSLTELANRRLLMHRLEDEWRRGLRSNEPLSLLLIDVDFFKLYNDHYGHPAGDACLQAVAAVLLASANRPSDLAARYGGEEFVLLLPHTDAEGAQAVAQRIMQRLRDAAVPHEMSPLGPFITVSMGLVSGQANSISSAAQWLAQADLVLYQAKAQGRNRVIQAAGY